VERLSRRDWLLIAAFGVAAGIFIGVFSGQPSLGVFYGIVGAVSATFVQLRSKR
jgi:drug/metabolite transporter (DMT)-like permease